MDAKKKTDAQKKIIRQLQHENKKQRSRIEKLEKEIASLKHKISILNENMTMATRESTSAKAHVFTQTKSNSFPEENVPEIQYKDVGEKT